jgi:hypothetical protein
MIKNALDHPDDRTDGITTSPAKVGSSVPKPAEITGITSIASSAGVPTVDSSDRSNLPVIRTSDYPVRPAPARPRPEHTDHVVEGQEAVVDQPADQHREQRLLRLHVHAGGRVDQDQHLRIARQRPGESAAFC